MKHAAGAAAPTASAATSSAALVLTTFFNSGCNSGRSSNVFRTHFIFVFDFDFDFVTLFLHASDSGQCGTECQSHEAQVG